MSYSDQSILEENVYTIRISKNRHERDGLLYALTDPRVFLGYKKRLIEDFKKYEAIQIQGAENIRLSEKDKQLFALIIKASPRVRELGFVNIGINGFDWIPNKEKFENFEFRYSHSCITVNFKGIEEFPNLQRILFYGFFDRSRNFECISKCQKSLSVFSAHSWFGKNIKCFGHFLLKKLVATELVMQEMGRITKLDYPELLEILEFYGTGEIGLDLSRLVNLKCLAFESFSNGVKNPIKATSLMGLDKLKGLYLSREAIDDVTKLKKFPFWQEIKR